MERPGAGAAPGDRLARWGKGLVPLVGAGTVDGGDLGLVEAQVDGELAAMVCEVAERAVGNHYVTWSFSEHSVTHLEAPRFLSMLLGGALECSA